MSDYILRTALAEPRADVILETFRSIGYSTEMAVADIVDNSIAAGAKTVSVWFRWNGPSSWITIIDDGRGMNESEIVEAMRPGSHNPLDDRDPKDLGRFGLGLKTASFSQCRRLTVISRRADTPPAHWCWSLDHVARYNRWELIQQLNKPHLLDECRQLPAGTIVLWEEPDRITGKTSADNEKQQNQFLELAHQVKQHLSMVFHRFLASGDLKIAFNDRPVEPWDPYMHGQPGLQPQAEEPLAGGRIIVKGYILPHISLLSAAAHQLGAGPAGWNSQQGFYIYRNERLLVAGSWLGFFKKEEHYKLARIRLDISSQDDAEWQIDIKKSVARPPAALRDELRRIADSVRRRAVEIYRHRGKVIQRSLTQSYVPVWQEQVRYNKRFYAINRTHPLISQMLSQPGMAGLAALLQMLEETVPVPLITLSESRQPEAQPVPYDNQQPELLGTMRLVFTSLRQTMSDEEARRYLLMIEPFSDHPSLLENL